MKDKNVARATFSAATPREKALLKDIVKSIFGADIRKKLYEAWGV